MSRSSGDAPTRAAAGRRWALVALVVVCIGVPAERVGVPAAWLIVGLAVGLAVALRTQAPPSLPALPLAAAQAVIGAALGAQMRPDVLTDVSRDLPAVIGAALATLALSVLAGVLLARFSLLDRPTAVLGMLAGAAEGVVAASQESGADARLVAAIQYLRLLFVLASVPVLVTTLFHGGSATGPGEAAAAAAAPAVGVLWFALIALIGALGAHRLSVPIGVLIGPLVVGAVVAALGVPVLAPGAVTAAALAILGLSVGLTFDMGTLRLAGRVLPATLGAIVLVIAGSGALGVLLGRLTGADALTAYLATSPGGLSAMLATAYDTGATVTLVLAVQLTRFMVMVVAGPLLAHYWSTPAIGETRHPV